MAAIINRFQSISHDIKTRWRSRATVILRNASPEVKLVIRQTSRIMGLGAAGYGMVLTSLMMWSLDTWQQAGWAFGFGFLASSAVGALGQHCTKKWMLKMASVTTFAQVHTNPRVFAKDMGRQIVWMTYWRVCSGMYLSFWPMIHLPAWFDAWGRFYSTSPEYTAQREKVKTLDRDVLQITIASLEDQAQHLNTQIAELLQQMNGCDIPEEQANMEFIQKLSFREQYAKYDPEETEEERSDRWNLYWRFHNQIRDAKEKGTFYEDVNLELLPKRYKLMVQKEKLEDEREEVRKRSYAAGEDAKLLNDHAYSLWWHFGPTHWGDKLVFGAIGWFFAVGTFVTFGSPFLWLGFGAAIIPARIATTRVLQRQSLETLQSIIYKPPKL